MAPRPILRWMPHRAMNAARAAARNGLPFPIPPKVDIDAHRTILHVKLHVAVAQLTRDPDTPAVVLRWRTAQAGATALAVLRVAHEIMDRFILQSVSATDVRRTV
jgi:hypothetical protein